MTPSGAVTLFPLKTFYAGPEDIVAGPDGNLWFSMAGGVGRVTPQGVVTELPAPLESLSPEGIAVGPDGAIWFATYSPDRQNEIGRAVPSAHPIVTGLTHLPLGAGLQGIVTGPDGNLWVAEAQIHAIARVTPGGQVTQYTLAADRYPGPMAVDRDGTIVFGYTNGAQAGLARFTVPG